MQLTLFFRRRLSILIAWLKIEAIETMNATADPSANFRLVIIQTELERFKFLVRSLLRARMAKVHSLTSGLLISLTEWRSPRSTPIHTTRSLSPKPLQPPFHISSRNICTTTNTFSPRIITLLFCLRSPQVCGSWTTPLVGLV
jgi:hypothetical protein